MASSRPLLHLHAAILLTVAVGCCGSDDDGDSGGSNANVSGVVFKGTLAAASLAVHELSDTGASGRFITSGGTDSEGRFNLSVANRRGWFLIKATGGTYTDEATGEERTVPDEHPLYGMVFVTESGVVETVVTPMTTIAFRILQTLGADPNSTTDLLAENAGRIVEIHFGLTDLYSTLPADLTAGPVDPGAQADAGVVVAGLSQLAASLQIGSPELAHKFADDFLDYLANGRRFETEVTLSSGQTYPPDAATLLLADAIEVFLNGARNQSGLAAADTSVDDVLRNNTSGDLIRPIEVLTTESLYGDATTVMNATITAVHLPPAGGSAVSVFADSRELSATIAAPGEISVTIPTDLGARLSDVRIVDNTTGLATLLRDGLPSGSAAGFPEVDAQGPARGPTVGGTVLELRGWHLYPTTEVQIDGIVAEIALVRPPSLIAVYAPAHATGLVDVTVLNGPRSKFLPASFRYDTRDIRTAAPGPNPVANTRLAIFRAFLDDADGLTAVTGFGEINWFNADSGSFSLDQRSVDAAGGTVSDSERSGDVRRSIEPLRWNIELDDNPTGEENRLRLDVAQRVLALSGTANDGIAHAWTVPANFSINTMEGQYFASGWIVNPDEGSIRQVAGWFEFGTDSRGSANLQELRQPTGGGARSFDEFRFGFGFSLRSDGSYLATVSDAENPALQFDGAFDATGSLGIFTGRDDGDSLCFYTLTRIDYGGGVQSFGGWTSGRMDSPDGSGFVYASQDLQFSAEEDGVGQSLSFASVRSTDPNHFAGQVGATAEAARWLVDPAGVARDASGLRVGFFNAERGVGLALGRFPRLDGSADSGALRIATGALLHPFARYSHRSMASEYWVVEQSYAWPDPAASSTSPVSAGAASRSQMARTTADADRPPQVLGQPFTLAGTLPTLEQSALEGFLKQVRRDSVSGDVSVSTGAPESPEAEIGFTFVNDTGHLFATRATSAGSPLADASFPLPLTKGTLGHDGELFVGEGTANRPEGTLSLLVEVIDPPRAVPVDARPCVELTWEFDTSVSPAPVSYVTKQGQMFFGLNQSDFQIVAAWSEALNDGTFNVGTQSAFGTVSIDNEGFLRMEVPARDNQSTNIYRGVSTPAHDFIVLLDDTRTGRPERSGMLTMVRREFASGATLRNWYLDAQSLDFPAPNGTPARSLTGVSDLTFLPTQQTRNLVGPELDRLNHPVDVTGNASPSLLLPGFLFRETLVTSQGTGAASAQFVGETTTLWLFFSDLGRTIGFVDFVSHLDSRIVAGQRD